MLGRSRGCIGRVRGAGASARGRRLRPARGRDGQMRAAMQIESAVAAAGAAPFDTKQTNKIAKTIRPAPGGHAVGKVNKGLIKS